MFCSFYNIQFPFVGSGVVWRQVEGVSYLDTSVKTDSSYEEQSASNKTSEQVTKFPDFVSVLNMQPSQANSEESEARLGVLSDQHTYSVNNFLVQISNCSSCLDFKHRLFNFTLHDI